MTFELDPRNNHKVHSAEDSFSENPESGAGLGTLDIQGRDRFELLSAYLDGEVTAAERRQVQEWLANDPQVQQLYQRLLRVHNALRTIPVPPCEVSVEQTVDQVFAKLDRRPKRALYWGGAAIAALFVGALASLIPGSNVFSPQFASSDSSAEPLMIALDKPLVVIPKAAVTESEPSLTQPGLPQPSPSDLQ
jgi:anti-sigma factor RsiW